MKPKSFSKVALENKARKHAIYLLIMVFITSALISLPFIFVDSSVKSNGLMRSLIYKNIITAPISARVKVIFIEEN